METWSVIAFWSVLERIWQKAMFECLKIRGENSTETEPAPFYSV